MKLFGKDKKTGGKADKAVAAVDTSKRQHQMSRINLLPWREVQRKEREIRFYASMGIALGVSALVFLGVHLYMQALIDYQKERNAYLNTEIKRAEEQIKEIKRLEEEKARLFQRMDVIKNLQTSRPQVVHMFDELVTTLPDGVYYTSFTQSGTNISLTGNAQSDARVSSLMRNLDKSPWFKNPKLSFTQLQTVDGRSVKQFALSIQQDAPKRTKEGDEAEEQSSDPEAME
jgi:type IV pilus assembly protein PilN